MGQIRSLTEDCQARIVLEVVNGRSLVTRDAIKVSRRLLWFEAKLTKQNSLEQIGDVKTVIQGDRNGYVSYRIPRLPVVS